jgi:hypothetical protein
MVKKGLIKRMMAITLCASLLVTTPGGSKVVNATETTSETTTTVTDSTDTTNVDANGTLGRNSDVGLEVTKSITGTAGKKTSVAFTIKSNDTDNVKIKSVYPVIDTAFPFETSGDAYKVVSAGNDEEKQKSMAVKFDMTARSDLSAGYQSVRFIGEYKKLGSDGTWTDYYVIKTINIYFKGATSTSTGSSSSGSSSGSSGSGSSSGSSSSSYYDDDDDDDDDDYSYGSSYSSGGSSSSSDDEATAPKLVITGYETKPEKIMAGETFTMTIHIQNTSKTTSVCNGKFLIGNEAGNFLPTSGSSAVYVESIPAGETGDIEIELKTSSDLAQKNYILVVKGDFDDGKGNSFTSSDNLSVPVYQEVKLAVTDVSMTPSEVGIDMEGSLMFTINNQGNASVNNVVVAVDDEAVTAEDCYVGNIAGSSSAYATLNVTGVADNSEKGTIQIKITYEDSEGNAGEMEQEIACVVGEDVEVDWDYTDDYYDDEEEGFTFPIWLIVLLCILAVAVIVVVVIILIKRKKKKEAELFDDDDDEEGEDDFLDEDF